MQRKMLIRSLVCMFLAPVLCLAAETVPKGPEAVIYESTFEFQPLVEGSQVVHDFIIHNLGDAPLKILKIKSG